MNKVSIPLKAGHCFRPRRDSDIHEEYSLVSIPLKAGHCFRRKKIFSSFDDYR